LFAVGLNQRTSSSCRLVTNVERVVIFKEIAQIWTEVKVKVIKIVTSVEKLDISRETAQMVQVTPVVVVVKTLLIHAHVMDVVVRVTYHVIAQTAAKEVVAVKVETIAVATAVVRVGTWLGIVHRTKKNATIVVKVVI